MSRQCCCVCLNLRQGSYLSAGYSIGLAVAGAISTGSAAFSFEQGSMESIINWLCLVGYIMWIVFAVVLIYGVRQNRRGMLLPWAIFTIILTCLLILLVILSLVAAKQTFGSPSGTISFIISLVIVLLNVYALWCVVTLYRNKMVVTE